MFQKIDHVNFSVRDIKESKDWYERIFGFREVEYGLNRSGSKFCVLERNDFMLCLSEHPDWKGLDQIGKKQHQVFHFGFRIHDEAQWRKILEKNELRISTEEMDYPRSKSWYVLDPDGYEIEVSCLQGHNSMF